jgi:hypothetical protein
VEYKVGQKVLLNVKNFSMLKYLSPKFMSKFLDPSSIVECILKIAYKLGVPPQIKVHPTFHVSLFKSFNP